MGVFSGSYHFFFSYSYILINGGYIRVTQVTEGEKEVGKWEGLEEWEWELVIGCGFGSDWDSWGLIGWGWIGIGAGWTDGYGIGPFGLDCVGNWDRHWALGIS